MSKGIVLSLCDFTGNLVRPWADAGYQCICVDIKHDGMLTYSVPGDGLMTFTHMDLLDPEEIKRLSALKREITFAAPPCTDLAVSGARHFKRKGLKRLIGALQLVEACREICEGSDSPYMIENPVSTLATYWRKPDYLFNPCDYAGYTYYEHPDKLGTWTSSDAYTKKTCLWTGNGFVMPDKKHLPPVLGSKMHKLPNTPDRAALRSETPIGFARAVFYANGSDPVTWLPPVRDAYSDGTGYALEAPDIRADATGFCVSDDAGR